MEPRIPAPDPDAHPVTISIHDPDERPGVTIARLSRQNTMLRDVALDLQQRVKVARSILERHPNELTCVNVDRALAGWSLDEISAGHRF